MVSRPLRKSYLLSILIISIIMIILPATISYADADRIFKENNKAIVVVVTYDKDSEPISQGSGFIVRADGAIVTNYHVISNAIDIKVKAGDKILEVEGLLYIDKENDLVILKAKGENFQTVKIGDIEKLNVGEKIYVISSPQGLENTISDGILSGIREIDPKRKILQITAPISPGSSGGPVFNKNGEVIGIATFLIEEAQNLNFAMPVNLIKDKILGRKVIALKDAGIVDYGGTAEYWFYLGHYYYEAGLYEKAVDAFKQAVRIKPYYAEVHWVLGLSYRRLGMYREAVDAYKQAIRIRPDNEVAHLGLGLAYSGLGMYREAIKAFEQSIKIRPDIADVYWGFGLAYRGLGMYREAIDAFKQAIRIKPDYAEAHFDLGVSYGTAGRHYEAIEALKQAIRIKPNFGDAHYMLGFAYLSIGNKGLALEQYKILKGLDPERAEKLFNLIYR